MDSWQQEVEELHEFFEAYFLGTIEAGDLARFESALADDFSYIGPDGSESDRAGTLAAVGGGHGHSESLKIRITDARLLLKTDDVVMGRYVENHDLADRTNERICTVTFSADPDGPNGLRWHAVHETWLPGSGHNPAE